jgi:hypothetical protein
MRNQSLSRGQIWGMPVLLGLLTALGVVSALVGDGLWDAFSWLALATPMVCLLWVLVQT